MVKSLLDWTEGLEEAASENPRKGVVLREEGEGLLEGLDMKSDEEVAQLTAIAIVGFLYFSRCSWFVSLLRIFCRGRR